MQFGVASEEYPTPMEEILVRHGLLEAFSPEAVAASGGRRMANLRRTRGQSLDGIVHEIYGSLSEDLSFERILGVVGCALRSHVTALHMVDLQAHRAWLEMVLGIGAVEVSDMAGAYATRWAGKNLWIERGIPGLLGKGYGAGEEVVSESELIHSEYYQHFLKPVDVHFGLGINVLNEAHSRLSIITMNRSKGVGSFQRDELLLVEQLRPHLVNAYSIYRRLVAMQETTTSLQVTFDHAPIGILALDASGHIVDKNAEASRLLGAKTGISCGMGNTLLLACPFARAKFRGALSRLGSACATPMPECLVIGKSGEIGIGPLVLHLCAFPVSVSQTIVRRGRILGFLCELGRHSETELGHRMLRSALNLTHMEVTVVMSLRKHNDPMRAALDLGLAISTVRSHLKHVFRKTGTTRQSELLRLVDGLLSAAPS